MRLLTLTRKIRIFPTAKQERILWDLSEKCRLLYNFALTERQQNWEVNRTKPPKTRTYITYSKQSADLPAIKKQFPEYTWVYSKVLQMVLWRLDADYKSFFIRWKNGDRLARPPRSWARGPGPLLLRRPAPAPKPVPRSSESVRSALWCASLVMSLLCQYQHHLIAVRVSERDPIVQDLVFALGVQVFASHPATHSNTKQPTLYPGTHRANGRLLISRRTLPHQQEL